MRPVVALMLCALVLANNLLPQHNLAAPPLPAAPAGAAPAGNGGAVDDDARTVAVAPLEPVPDTTRLVQQDAYFLDIEHRKGPSGDDK